MTQLNIQGKGGLVKRERVRISPQELYRRYLSQIDSMIETARRLNNERVILALTTLRQRRTG